jgi:hypothetical protein
VIALSGTKLSSDSGDRPHQVDALPARRSTRRRRALLLAPVLLSLFFGAAAEYGLRDIRSADKEGIFPALKGIIVAALKDPFALFDERSPGSRSPGALYLTKSSTGPHERVLSQVREREPAPDLTPGADNPVFADSVPAVASPPVAVSGDLPNGQDSVSHFPSFINTPPGFPGIPAASGGSPGGTDTAPGGPGGIDTPPGNPGGTDTPPGGPGGTDTPPGNRGGTPGDTPPPTIAIPEPATWALMILGLLSVLLIVRRHENRRTA